MRVRKTRTQVLVQIFPSLAGSAGLPSISKLFFLSWDEFQKAWQYGTLLYSAYELSTTFVIVNPLAKMRPERLRGVLFSCLKRLPSLFLPSTQMHIPPNHNTY